MKKYVAILLTLIVAIGILSGYSSKVSAGCIEYQTEYGQAFCVSPNSCGWWQTRASNYQFKYTHAICDGTIRKNYTKTRLELGCCTL